MAEVGSAAFDGEPGTSSAAGGTWGNSGGNAANKRDVSAAFERELARIGNEVGATGAKRFIWQRRDALLEVLAAAREMQRTSGGREEGDAWVRLSAALRGLDA